MKYEISDIMGHVSKYGTPEEQERKFLTNVFDNINHGISEEETREVINRFSFGRAMIIKKEIFDKYKEDIKIALENNVNYKTKNEDPEEFYFETENCIVIIYK